MLRCQILSVSTARKSQASSHRDRVGFRPTSNFGLKYWPSALRDVHRSQTPSVAVWARLASDRGVYSSR